MGNSTVEPERARRRALRRNQRTRTVRRRRGSASRGQSMVELALLIPVFAVLVFGIIDFGMGIRTYISLTNATREGARFAAVGNPPGSYPSECDGGTSTTVIGRVCLVSEGVDRARITGVSVEYPDGEGAGNSVVVSASYTYHYTTPLGDILSFLSGGALDETMELSATTDMRLE